MSDDPEHHYATIFSILIYYLSLTYCHGSMSNFSLCHYVGFGLCTPSFRLQFLGSACVLGRDEDWIFVLDHRNIRVGEDLQDHLVQPSPYYQCHPLNHVPKHHAQPFLKHPQGR